jgi:hypothetical protein
MWVLDCNDAGLRLSENGELRLESPGIVSLDGPQLLIGEAARRRWRLAPRQSHHRYWYALDQQPLERPLGEARSAADLAWHQLLQLRDTVGEAPLLLAVPTSFDRAQLALLLGLCRAARLRAVGLVDSAVAATAARVRPGPVCHLDVQLHRFWLTRMEAGEDLASRAGSDVAKPGLTAVWDALATAIAEQFVRQTRFDPLHSAATEQSLFDALPGWIEALAATPSLTLELHAAGRVHRAQVTRDALHAALAPLLQRLVAALRSEVGADTQLVLSDRAAAVPGLLAALQTLGAARLQVLPPDAVAQGALAQADRIRSEQEALPWVTRLPLSGREAVPDVVAAADPAPAGRPTHLLMGASAARLAGHPALRDEAALTWRDDGPWLAAGARCNGQVLDQPRRLQAGDRIEVDGLPAQLILVRD